MATVSKFTRGAVAGNGWSNTGNASADDSVFATATPAKNQTVTGDWDFAAFTDAELPVGATINFVVAEVQWKVSTTSSVATLGITPILNGSPGPEGVITAEPTFESTEQKTFDTTPSETDLKTAGNLVVRCRATRGNSNTAFTASIDYVKVTVDYTASAFVTADTTVTGTGTVNPVAAAIRSVVSAITGSGSVSPSATVIRGVETSVTGTGTVSPTAATGSVVDVATTVTASGTVAPTAGVIRGVATSVSGSGSLSPVAVAIRGAKTVVTAAGSLAASAARLVGVATTVTGTGTVNASVSGTSKKHPPKGTASMMGLGI